MTKRLENFSLRFIFVRKALFILTNPLLDEVENALCQFHRAKFPF